MRALTIHSITHEDFYSVMIDLRNNQNVQLDDMNKTFDHYSVYQHWCASTIASKSSSTKKAICYSTKTES
jgi:hypothetical protein